MFKSERNLSCAFYLIFFYFKNLKLWEKIIKETKIKIRDLILCSTHNGYFGFWILKTGSLEQKLRPKKGHFCTSHFLNYEFNKRIDKLIFYNQFINWKKRIYKFDFLNTLQCFLCFWDVTVTVTRFEMNFLGMFFN